MSKRENNLPRYTFLDSNTNEYFEVEMKISEYEEYVKSNPHLIREYCPMTFVERRKLMGGFKTDNVFSERLKQIHKNHYGSKMNIGNIVEL